MSEAVTNGWKKLATPTVPSGATGWPKKPADQERIGIRFDYDRLITDSKDGKQYHLFKMQANAGKIPSALKEWRDKHGTHAVMAPVRIPKDATESQVAAALEAAKEEFKSKTRG
ncbi:hypothetical protein SISNIDRAFT_470448 [Sistotremastrum niveocremeum HHB9708]|uniref:Uncharacterized protein n=1 Tax=Sistotremastrum niveocremeum HHB9708 TaxID=1314777 RepID=A0A164NXL1_9AGAM|nr:hypothetical protein SISNIDRAFT_470448 [Sistotremastrum niveocremeum HHB9708]